MATKQGGERRMTLQVVDVSYITNKHETRVEMKTDYVLSIISLLDEYEVELKGLSNTAAHEQTESKWSFHPH